MRNSLRLHRRFSGKRGGAFEAASRFAFLGILGVTAENSRAFTGTQRTAASAFGQTEAKSRLALRAAATRAKKTLYVVANRRCDNEPNAATPKPSQTIGLLSGTPAAATITRKLSSPVVISES